MILAHRGLVEPAEEKLYTLVADAVQGTYYIMYIIKH